MSDIILEARNISKTFNDPVKVNVLTDISFSIAKGELVALTGKSGCGKSTLLYILSTLDTDYEGMLLIDDEPMKPMSQAALAHVRNEKIGFVFQFHYLLEEFSVMKNVILPGLKLAKYSEKELLEKAAGILSIMGIEQLASKKANQISGGEKQRVAIARALINDPDIIMGDEPTGNLDKKNSDIVFDLFKRLSTELKQTLLIVTHDQSFADRTQRIIQMEDGKIINNGI